VSRRPRLELPGFPLHITHRGVNRAAVFYDDDDRRRYLRYLREASDDARVAVHAYVLMTNHVHLLVTADRDGAISRAMQQVGHRYVTSFNRRHARTGTLWEGRFRSSLVDTDAYALAVYRYIELNPVRAGLVERPEQYRWSSVHANTGRLADPLVQTHAVFDALGQAPSSCHEAYREWLRAAVPADAAEAIRMHLRQERALGDDAFQSRVATALGRSVAPRGRGRPRKQKGSEEIGV